MRLASSRCCSWVPATSLASAAREAVRGALETILDERTQKLTHVEHELLHQSAIDPVTLLHTQQRI
jgi:hypothetical protein